MVRPRRCFREVPHLPEWSRKDAVGHRYREPPLILYLDTSGLVKLLIDEPESAQILGAVEGVATATSVLAYAEACAALATASRSRRIASRAASTARQALDDRWLGLRRVAATEVLVRRAGDLALSHNLRGYDAVHLAAALTISAVDAVTVATWDRDLHAAAQSVGLAVFPASLS